MDEIDKEIEKLKKEQEELLNQINNEEEENILTNKDSLIEKINYLKNQNDLLLEEAKLYNNNRSIKKIFENDTYNGNIMNSIKILYEDVEKLMNIKKNWIEKNEILINEKELLNNSDDNKVEEENNKVIIELTKKKKILEEKIKKNELNDNKTINSILIKIREQEEVNKNLLIDFKKEKLIYNRFIIINFISKGKKINKVGSFGSVFKCKDINDDKFYALKKINIFYKNKIDTDMLNKALEEVKY
jgi:hypothetical protein